MHPMFIKTSRSADITGRGTIIYFIRWPCGKYLLVRSRFAIGAGGRSSLFVLFIISPATACRKLIRIYRSTWQTAHPFANFLFFLTIPAVWHVAIDSLLKLVLLLRNSQKAFHFLLDNWSLKIKEPTKQRVL